MLDDLKNFSPSRMNMPELVQLSALGRSVEAEFTELGVEAPPWIADSLKAVRREIKAKNSDSLHAKLRELQSRREALKTPDEKRSALDDEITKLQTLANQ